MFLLTKFMYIFLHAHQGFPVVRFFRISGFQFFCSFRLTYIKFLNQNYSLLTIFRVSYFHQIKSFCGKLGFKQICFSSDTFKRIRISRSEIKEKRRISFFFPHLFYLVKWNARKFGRIERKDNLVT